jgi:septal ring factor EnvC (AmiA/AmiB activator)
MCLSLLFVISIPEEDYDRRFRQLLSQIEQLHRSNQENQQHVQALEKALQEAKDKIEEQEHILKTIRSTTISLSG